MRSCSLPPFSRNGALYPYLVSFAYISRWGLFSNWISLALIPYDHILSWRGVLYVIFEHGVLESLLLNCIALLIWQADYLLVSGYDVGHCRQSGWVGCFNNLGVIGLLLAAGGPGQRIYPYNRPCNFEVMLHSRWGQVALTLNVLLEISPESSLNILATGLAFAVAEDRIGLVVQELGLGGGSTEWSHF